MPRKPKPRSWREIWVEASLSILSLAGLIFFSWLNASSFDKTEYQTIAEVALYLKGLTTLREKLL